MRVFLILAISFLMMGHSILTEANPVVKKPSFETFYIAKELKVIQILPSVYVIEDQGGIAPSYSMIVDISDENLLLVDTTDSEKTKHVLQWANKKFGKRKIVAINTHHHSDRTGGNDVLIEEGIPVYGSDLAASLVKEEHEIAPNHIFAIKQGKVLTFDNKKVRIFYPGPAHTPDNVVVYIPHLKLLFGGCMVVPFKKVYRVPDANIDAWPESLGKLKQFDIEWVIPGHPANLKDDLNFSPTLIEHTAMLLNKGMVAEFTKKESEAIRGKVASQKIGITGQE